MSMILDALKRADRERRQQDLEVPTLDTHHGERSPGVRNRRLWLIGSGLLVFAFLVAGGIALIQAPWQPESRSAETQPETGKAQPQSAQTKPTARQQTAANPQQTTIEALYQEQAQMQVEQDSGRTLTREEIANLYRQAIEDTPEQDPDDQESRGTASAEVMETPTTTERPAASAALDAASAEASDDSRPSALSGLPQIHTLSQSMQRNIPSINYQEHHYQPGGGSWVRLNRERKQVGDPITPDLRIESIDREGLVLNYRGRSFRLKALNSWINM